MDILEKLEQLIITISNNNQLKVEKNNIEEIKESKDYISNMIFEQATKAIAVEIPKADYQYDSISSLILDWSAVAEPDETYLWGGFQILGLFESLGYPSHFWKIYNDSRFWKNNPQPEAEAISEEFLPKLNFFHKSGHGDDGTFGCILREKGVYPCPIYFYDKGIWFKMDMTLGEYYDTMILCKAVFYWQYFYIDTAEIVMKLGNFKPRFKEYGAYYFEGPTGASFLDQYEDGTFTTSAEGVLHQMKIIIKRFPKLFPDVDLTYFKERCDALEKALNL